MLKKFFKKLNKNKINGCFVLPTASQKSKITCLITSNFPQRIYVHSWIIAGGFVFLCFCNND